MAEDVVTFDEILEDPTYKAEFDRRVTKALSTVQSKLDKEVAARGTMKTAEDYAALQKERDESMASLTALQSEMEQYRREKFLIGKGISADDVDYYTFKIGKLVTDEKTFEAAAEEYLKDKQTTNTVRVDLGAALSGAKVSNTTNESMNQLLRGLRR